MADCTTCLFSQVDMPTVGDDSYADGPLMRCHRYPPQLFPFDGEAAQAYPNVGPDDWCGEWQPQPDERRGRGRPEPTRKRRNPSG